MIIPFPITFSINFAVGVKYVVAEFQLAAGDDSQEIITQFIQKENIPIYLENNIISTVESFLIDAIQREQDEEDEKCGMIIAIHRVRMTVKVIIKLFSA